MAISSSDIVISPAAAATAGCSASATLADSWADRGDWHKVWRFEATAGQGWVFDHWEQSYFYQEPRASGTSGNFTGSSGINPWLAGSFSLLGTEEWYYDYTQVGPEYIRPSERSITALTAVFKRLSSGLILRSAASGLILRGAAGTILTDD